MISLKEKNMRIVLYFDPEKIKGKEANLLTIIERKEAIFLGTPDYTLGVVGNHLVRIRFFIRIDFNPFITTNV